MKRRKRPQMQLFKTQREVDWRNPKTRATAQYWIGKTKADLAKKKDPLPRHCPKHDQVLHNEECQDCFLEGYDDWMSNGGQPEVRDPEDIVLEEEWNDHYKGGKQ